MSTPVKTRRGGRWTLAELKQLGKVPDSVLAREYSAGSRHDVQVLEAGRAAFGR